MEIFLICFAFLMIVVASFIPNNDKEDKIAIFCVYIICSLLLSSGVYSLAYNKGIKNGAYNQLRGKYEVTYVIDKDSCVVDTIININ